MTFFACQLKILTPAPQKNTGTSPPPPPIENCIGPDYTLFTSIYVLAFYKSLYSSITSQIFSLFFLSEKHHLEQKIAAIKAGYYRRHDEQENWYYNRLCFFLVQ